MKKAFYTLFILGGLLLFAACGADHNAKGLAKQFMSEQMGLKDYDILAWSEIDSTHHVKDSMLQVMHQIALKDKIVKAGTTYAPRTDKLNLLSVRYKLGNDTVMSTFYFDDQLKGIVGVKSSME